MQLMQTMTERGAREGVRDKNKFLNNKSGAKPAPWAGDPGKEAGWKAKVKAHIRMVGKPRVDDWVKRGQTQEEPVTADAREPESGEYAGDVMQFSSARHSELTRRLGGVPFVTLHSVSQGNGLEARRQTTSRYEPRTVQTKRSYLITPTSTQHAKRVEELDVILPQGRHLPTGRDASIRPVPLDIGNQEEEKEYTSDAPEFQRLSHATP